MIRLIPLFVLLLLSACTTAPERPQPTDPELAWLTHRQQLQGLENWNLAGRLAIQNENEGWHLSLSWQQQQESYTINLIAPLGQGAMRLQGTPHRVVLQSDDGETVSAEDPDQLLYLQLGWKVPVAALRYWVLGMPAPGDSTHTIDEYGRLSTLQQAGWNIEFHDYVVREGGVELPRKLFVSNHHAEVRLVIGEWKPLPPGSGGEG